MFASTGFDLLMMDSFSLYYYDATTGTFFQKKLKIFCYKIEFSFVKFLMKIVASSISKNTSKFHECNSIKNSFVSFCKPSNEIHKFVSFSYVKTLA
jgi:hypothetical protein